MQNTTLVAPDGREYQTSDPVEFNNLVYGQGYKVKSGRSYDAVVGSGKDDAPAKDSASTGVATDNAPAAAKGGTAK